MTLLSEKLSRLENEAKSNAAGFLTLEMVDGLSDIRDGLNTTCKRRRGEVYKRDTDRRSKPFKFKVEDAK